MKHLFYFLFVTSLFSSCTVEPKPISYGEDHCNFCDMTVVDKTHAAELTTKKGRSTIFDAIECMTREIIQEKSEEKMAFILVADYAHPGEMTNAQSAIYLISKKIKSPMGANLSAFSSIKEATKFQEEFGGDLLDWDQLKDKLSK